MLCVLESPSIQLVAAQPGRLDVWRILGELLVFGAWERLKRPGYDCSRDAASVTAAGFKCRSRQGSSMYLF